MTLTERQETFLEFVKYYHGSQKRKYSGEPYWTHPLAVAEIVDSVSDISQLIEVALGHDLVEDTPCEIGDIYDFLRDSGQYETEEIEFICQGIYHLSDEYRTEKYPQLNRKIRKRMESQRLHSIPSVYQTVKYADLIHNSKSILERDPKFAQVYLTEKREILSGMDSGDSSLYEQCMETVR